MQILIPSADAERRACAHRIDDGRAWSLCGMRPADGCDIRPDSPETFVLLRQMRRHMCGLCNDILRRRAQAVETQRQEAERKAQPRPPTRREREAAALIRWNAAAKLATKSTCKHDEDHVADAASLVA